MVVTLGQQNNVGKKSTVILYTYINRQQYNVGEKPTVILYTYINRQQYVCMNVCMVITYSRVWINRVRLPILLVVS